MNSQKIKGIPHYVFENDKEFVEFFESKPPPLAADWRSAKERDWVRADDGGIVQILRRGELNHHNDRPNYTWASGWVRTVVGTFVCHPNQKMDTNFALHPNRYTFSGKTPHFQVVIKNRKNLTKAERAFCFNIAAGMGLEASYKDAYQYTGLKAREKGFLLMKQERVVTEINKSITDLADDMGINHKFILKGLKELFEDKHIDNATAFRALMELGKAIGTVGNQPKLLSGGVAAVSFGGFEQKHLDRIEEDGGEAEVVVEELPSKTDSVEEAKEE
jgi:hypothetical protein